ncbi:hypothetical protein V6S67_07835 [Arthrobacter sp. Soc17.1.1.1]|uniref:hypothetical protein n=1 Tax=Arthrobacter sp. Soc17.1.1.1 TaxID=3121277 RepID=UPI002FE445F6
MCVAHNSMLSTLLENPLAPLLKTMMAGEETTLSPEQQALLLAWLIKTTALFDLVALEEFERRERDHTRGKRSREELQDLVLQLIARGGVPLDTWAAAVCYVIPEDGRSTSTRSPLPAIERPDHTAITSYPHLVALSTWGTEAQANAFRSYMGALNGWHVLTNEATENLDWRVNLGVTPSDVATIRSAAGHLPPMGWVFATSERERQQAKRNPTITMHGDDPQDLQNVGHALAELGVARIEVSVYNPGSSIN